jgi:hypothetical protein
MCELIYVPTILHEFFNFLHANTSKLQPACATANEKTTMNVEEQIPVPHTMDNLFEMYQSPSFSQLTDIMLMALWLGNDYLPKFKTFQLIKSLEVYRNLVQQQEQISKMPFTLLNITRRIQNYQLAFSDCYMIHYQISSFYTLLTNLYQAMNQTILNSLMDEAAFNQFSPTQLINVLCKKRRWTYLPEYFGPNPYFANLNTNNNTHKNPNGTTRPQQTLFMLEVLPFALKLNETLPLPYYYNSRSDHDTVVGGSCGGEDVPVGISGKHQLTGNEKDISNFIIYTPSALPEIINCKKQWKNLCALLIMKLFYSRFYHRFLSFLQDLSAKDRDHDFYSSYVNIIQIIQYLPNCSNDQLKEQFQQQLHEMKSNDSILDENSLDYQNMNHHPMRRQHIENYEKIGNLAVDICEKFGSIFADPIKRDSLKGGDGVSSSSDVDEDDNDIYWKTIESFLSPSKNDENLENNDDYEDNPLDEHEEDGVETAADRGLKTNDDAQDKGEDLFDEETIVDEKSLSDQTILERILLKSIQSYNRTGIPATSQDIVSYLKGFLWILEMYLHGKCLDHSFSFQGNAPTLRQVIEWIEGFARNQSISLKLVGNNDTNLPPSTEELLSHPLIIEKFQEELQSPRSAVHPMTSEAVCVAVNRPTLKGVVPFYLR